MRLCKLTLSLDAFLELWHTQFLFFLSDTLFLFLLELLQTVDFLFEQLHACLIFFRETQTLLELLHTLFLFLFKTLIFFLSETLFLFLLGIGSALHLELKSDELSLNSCFFSFLGSSNISWSVCLPGAEVSHLDIKFN